jgi:Ca2+-transporting ATPase
MNEKTTMWHNISWEQTLEKYDSDIEQGLTEKQIINQREKFGLNELPKEKPLSNIKMFLDQIKSPLIYVFMF